LATFHVFDKENAGPPPLFQKLRLAAGCRAGCGFGCALPSPKGPFDADFKGCRGLSPCVAARFMPGLRALRWLAALNS
jgi:hypothetical protein